MKKILTILVSFFVLASCSSTPVDIINPDANFLYFYGATCPHCQELNAYLENNDMYPELSLEKREVYYNADNNALFLALSKELGIAQSELGVPFVYNKTTGKYTVGVQPAIDQFTASIESSEEIPSTPLEITEIPESEVENTISTESN